jgi:hypothetical protein
MGPIISILTMMRGGGRTCDAVGDAERYTPGSTIEKRVGTCMSEGPGCFDIASQTAGAAIYSWGG